MNAASEWADCGRANRGDVCAKDEFVGLRAAALDASIAKAQVGASLQAFAGRGLPREINEVFSTYTQCDGDDALRELVRTSDAVVISAIEALLKGAGIAHMIADQNISTVEPIGIFPRRILVDEDEFAAARRLLVDAGFGNELRPDKA